MELTRGPNFEIRKVASPVGGDDEPTWLQIKVWVRPDLSRAAGARLAETMAETIERFASDSDGVVLDFREATTEWGPSTEQAIARMLNAPERARVPVVVLHADEAIQQIALRKLIHDHAPTKGTLHPSLEAWAQHRATRPSGSSMKLRAASAQRR